MQHPVLELGIHSHRAKRNDYCVTDTSSPKAKAPVSDPRSWFPASTSSTGGYTSRPHLHGGALGGPWDPQLPCTWESQAITTCRLPHTVLSLGPTVPMEPLRSGAARGPSKEPSGLSSLGSKLQVKSNVLTYSRDHGVTLASWKGIAGICRA